MSVRFRAAGLSFALAGLSLAGLARAADTKKDAVLNWVAPPEERARKNPVEASPDALKKGHALYQRNCAMCHGDHGKGDGSAARMHRQKTGQAPRDLTDPAQQTRLTDGEIFWKISTGLKEEDHIIMPAFGQEISKDEDRWKVVLFVRALGKPD